MARTNRPLDKMKTIAEIVKSGCVKDYTALLIDAIRHIVPSKDGRPGNPCNVILIVCGDDTGGVEDTIYGSDLRRGPCVKLLREMADLLEKGEGHERIPEKEVAAPGQEEGEAKAEGGSGSG